MTAPSETVSRALSYPYAVPSRSFVLAGGRAHDLGAVEVDLSSRRPLLAYGSNAAPAVLARKLGRAADPIPVVRAVLADFDIVYSAHISPYGAVPAAVQRSPGTEAPVFLAHVTDEQLRALSGTEANYELRPFPGTVRTSRETVPLSDVAAYVSRHGCLTIGGVEVALTSVAARDRRFPAMSEAEVLEWVRQAVCPARALEDFICSAVADRGLAQHWTERLRMGARGLA